jgi:hypothetical protein
MLESSCGSSVVVDDVNAVVPDIPDRSADHLM